MQVVIHATTKHKITIDNETAKEFMKLLKIEIIEEDKENEKINN